MEINTEAGSAFGQTTFAAPSTSDNSKESVFVSCEPSSPAKVNLGTTTVTCVATDKSDNTARCSFKITVLDAEAPKLSCEEKRTGVTAQGQGTGRPSNTENPAATDNSGYVFQQRTIAALSLAPLRGPFFVACGPLPLVCCPCLLS
jgi:hypothetical protein